MTLLQAASDAIGTVDLPESTEELIRILQKFSCRFAINLVSVIILIRLIYFRIYKNSEYFFTFFISCPYRFI